MTNGFKKGIDRMMWVQAAPAPNTHAAGGCLCSDLRNTTVRNPYVYYVASATVLNKYNILQKAWGYVQSPALAGTFGAGAGCVFAPSRAVYGTVAAGCSTTSIVLSTALPTSVGANMLANRGGGTYGFMIRIIGNAAGSSGKTEERWITGNTSGTTPTLTLDSALSFTPANGDTYEILSGKIFMLNAGTTASNIWRSFEVATNTLSSGLSTTNLPGTIGTDSFLLALDEAYVPYDRVPGEGFVVGASTYDTSKGCLLATAIAAGTITGQASAGDAAVLANEYRNFQIRIVEDTGTPTAVGQRRMIASHTAGASPVYTLGSNWTTTPSANAKFVIEYPNLILRRGETSTTLYVYNYSGATINNGTNTINADAWSTTYFGTASGAAGAGVMMFPAFSIEPDTAKNARHSYIFTFRGGATSSVDLLDIAGGTTGSWASGIVIDGAVSITTGSGGELSPADFEGRYAYFNSYVASQINQMYRFDVKNRVVTPIVPTGWVQAGTAAVGGRVTAYVAIDGTDKYGIIILLSHLATNVMELLVLV